MEIMFFMIFSDVYVDAKPQDKNYEPHSCECVPGKYERDCGEDCLNR